MKKIVILAYLLLANFSWATEFKQCDDAHQFSALNTSLCAIVNAPQGYQKDQTETVDLFVRKFPSLKQRQGSVWLLAGGPGESGASFYPIIETYRETFAHFDVFVPDHRGTGFSSSICPGEKVGSVAGKTLVGEEWGACFSHMYANVKRIEAFNITNAAKDLRYLINTMSGSGQVYVYGVSYGTQLALRTTQLDNLNINGIILDSLVPMQDDKDFDLSKRSQVVDAVGQELLKKCNKPSACNGETSDSIKLKLVKILNKSNNLASMSSNLPDTSLTNTLGTLLDIPHLRNLIPEIIIGLANNDPTKLEQAVNAATAYYNNFNPGYANFVPSIPLVSVITSSENNLRPKLTKADLQTEEKTLLFTSPLPALMAENSMPTYQKDQYFSVLPTRLPRTLILHGTLDPKTHYQAAKKHSVELSKVGKVSFVDVTDGVHFIALNAPTCFRQTVELFMTSDKQPQTICQDDKTRVRF